MDLSFALSCWGSALATILAALKIRESFSVSRQALLVDARTDDLSTLNIRVTNIARRPLTLMSVGIAYGTASDTFLGQPIDTIKLNESDTFSVDIARSDIVAAALNSDVKQRYRCRLVVTVTTTSGNTFSSVLHVPHRIIAEPHFENARDWIAADLYIGFTQMQSKTPTMPLMK